MTDEKNKEIPYTLIKINGKEIEPRFDYKAIQYLNTFLKERGDKINGMGLCIKYGSDPKLFIDDPIDGMRMIWLSLRYELQDIDFDDFLDLAYEEKWSIYKSSSLLQECLRVSIIFLSADEKQKTEKKNGQSKKTTKQHLDKVSNPPNFGN